MCFEKTFRKLAFTVLHYCSFELHENSFEIIFKLYFPSLLFHLISLSATIVVLNLHYVVAFEKVFCCFLTTWKCLECSAHSIHTYTTHTVFQ